MRFTRSSGLDKTILQGTTKRERRQKKRWENDIREWTGLEFTESQRAVEDKENWVGSHIRCLNEGLRDR